MESLLSLNLNPTAVNIPRRPERRTIQSDRQTNQRPRFHGIPHRAPPSDSQFKYIKPGPSSPIRTIFFFSFIISKLQTIERNRKELEFLLQFSPLDLCFLVNLRSLILLILQPFPWNVTGRAQKCFDDKYFEVQEWFLKEKRRIEDS